MSRTPLAVTLPVTLKLPATECDPVPLALKFPETVKLSSTVTVPPVESIVKFPLEVSISLSPVTPIRILPKLPPLEVISLVALKVPAATILPPTFKFLAIPAPPSIFIAPVVVLVD